MALVVWSDKLSVGIKSIDEQHSILFNSINELHAAMMKGQARTIIGGLLHTLLEYTHFHFAAEEAMMAKANYPQLPTHRIKHRELTKKVEDFVARFDRGDTTVSNQLLTFLSDWLANHIQGTDKEYGPLLNEQGVR
jgi:hemerythrin